MNPFKTTPPSPTAEGNPSETPQNPSVPSGGEKNQDKQEPTPPPTPPATETQNAAPKLTPKTKEIEDDDPPPTTRKPKTKQLLILAGLVVATTAVILLNKNKYAESIASSIKPTAFTPEETQSLEKWGGRAQWKPKAPEGVEEPPQTPVEPTSAAAKPNDDKTSQNEHQNLAQKSNTKSNGLKILKITTSKIDGRLYVLTPNGTVLEFRRKPDIKKVLENRKGSVLVETKPPSKASQKRNAKEREMLSKRHGAKEFLEVETLVEILPE